MASVLVCGGGIGGLTAGIALAQHGFDVRVLERAVALEPAGAGITVQVNAMRVMQRLGIADQIADAGALLSAAAIRTSDGRVLRAMDQGALVREHGAPFVAIHRARLQDVLVRALGRERLATGATVTGVTADAAGARVTLADGSTQAADLVIGADGLHSAVRASLFGAEPPRAAGQTSWRGIAPRRAGGDDPGGESWGRGARFGFVPIGAAETYWYAVLDTPMAPPADADQHAALLRVYRDWHAPVPQLVAATDPRRVLRTELFDRPPADAWGRGPVTLLGDAAHPMTPNLGQGGCQAIEDAWVLARELAGDPSPRGLRRYEAARRPRTRRFVVESWRFGKIAQTSNRLVIALRNAAMRLAPESRMQASLAWAFEFDPDA